MHFQLKHKISFDQLDLDWKIPAWLVKSLKILAINFLILLGLVSILLCFAIDDSPQEIINQGLNRDDIQRAKQILHISPEERNSIKTVSLNQKDLNIAVSYLLNHYIESTTAIRIDADRIAFQIAIFVPKSPWGRYLDFSFNVRQNQNGIYLKSLKIGEISIPDKMANWLIPFIVHNTKLNQYWQLATEYIKDVNITPKSLNISYLGSIVEQTKQLAIQKHKDYPSLHIYQQKINEIVTLHDPDWRLSIMELLQPLFATAYQRSNEDTAINENKAVIIAVASYVFKSELRHYLPIGLIYNKEYPVFAYKRIDIPQHFIAAALLSAVDSKVLTQQLSVDKEVGDAQHGSGFSFIDLLADQAGIRFGQMLTASPAQALKLQQLLANSKDYANIIPNPQDLPEHMDEESFKQRFNEVGSPAYQAIIEQIEARIQQLEVYN